MISSYGVIIFSVTRDQLLREGIPLGLAASGFSFARISYFWSPALWGAISALVISSKIQGVCLVSLISLGGLIAVTAGPASAILMLPRPTVWALPPSISMRSPANPNSVWSPELARFHHRFLAERNCRRFLAVHIDVGPSRWESML